MADETDLLNQIRKVVREEVEAEAKKTRSENSMSWVRFTGRIDELGSRVKDVELSNLRIEKGQQEQGKKLVLQP
jgi:hypothetical protein